MKAEWAGDRGRKAARGQRARPRVAGIAMALTVAGFVAGGTQIDTTEAVEVSYPGFFQQMAGLGAGSLMGSPLRFQCF